ncbi:hypothetical protein KKG85_01565, partial [Patescibacteria group bacterium]|nr:hypothetical protein [Patescibacteria group bacterium]
MGNDFSDLSTVKFQEKLKPYALEIYQNLFPGCYLQDLREEGVNVHILDKEFGIDSLIVLKSQQWISIQEKYRDYKFLITPYLQVEPPYPDFTQEFKNGYGTNYEQPGEWFKLGAQLYFYGWANETNTEFERWVLL